MPCCAREEHGAICTQRLLSREPLKVLRIGACQDRIGRPASKRGKPREDGRSQDGTGARPNPSAQTALLTNAKGGRPPPLRIRGEAGAVPAWNRKKPTRRMAIGKAGEKAHRAIHAA